jgi:predicted acylesterase/phospholipase RssA
LAIQGGGARLSALLAALDAVQHLDDPPTSSPRVLEVTRLAGTSAGAVAAALFAARVDFQRIRQRLQDKQEELLAMAPVPSKAFMLWKAWRGQPVVDLAPINRVLTSELVDPKTKQPLRFGDLRKRPFLPLTVIATDLTSRKTEIFSPERTPDEFVATAVTESMALPGYFRAYGKRGGGKLLVDGGVCENFPVNVLCDDEETFGPVVGVTFFPNAEPDTPTNLFDFAYSLLDSAMSNSVRRAQVQLGEERLLQLPAELGLFDFKRALGEGIGATYDTTFRRATDFFEEIASIQTPKQGKVLESVGQPEESATVLQRVADIYNAQHSGIRMRYHEIRMIVRIGALTQTESRREVGSTHELGAWSAEAAAPGVQPDQMSYRLEFSAADTPLACARVTVADEPTARFLRTYRKAVYNRHGQEVRTIDLLARDQAQPKDRGYLLFFDPVIRTDDDDAPFTLEYTQQVLGMMSGLGERGTDFLAVHTTRAFGPTNRILLVALVPETHPNVEITGSDRTTGSVRGRRLTDQEINKMGLSVDAGYYAIGWLGEKVESQVQFAAQLVDPYFSRQPGPLDDARLA